jgi:hypothetical protein
MNKFSLHHPFFNLLIFKLSWLLLVVWQQRGVWLALLLLIISLLLQPDRWSAWQRALPVALVGIAVDQMLSLLGVFQFATSLLPLWLVVLWLHFGAVLPYGFRFLQLWPRWAQALTGAIAGPCSYWMGSLQGGVVLTWPLLLTVLTLALLWSLLLPGLIWLAVHKLTPTARHSTLPLLLLATLTLSSHNSAAEESTFVLVGEANYRFMWWPLYQAQLHAPSSDFQFPATTPFKLSLTYQRAITKQQLLTETLKQWQRQGITVEPHWQPRLNELLVDVAVGDTLSLYVDSTYVSRLSLDEQALGAITDPALSQAFAGIWLASNSTEPQFRQQLLGLSP